jgi:hypothetical protein
VVVLGLALKAVVRTVFADVGGVSVWRVAAETLVVPLGPETVIRRRALAGKQTVIEVTAGGVIVHPRWCQHIAVVGTIGITIAIAITIILIIDAIATTTTIIIIDAILTGPAGWLVRWMVPRWCGCSCSRSGRRTPGFTASRSVGAARRHCFVCSTELFELLSCRTSNPCRPPLSLCMQHLDIRTRGLHHRCRSPLSLCMQHLDI